jgi:UDP-3-O-[3-hydroxymyristoyl] glucosamine N-acyltransferase
MNTREIAELINGELIGVGEVEITSVASLDAARTGDIAFCESNEPFSTNASCAIVPLNYSGSTGLHVVRVRDPKLAFSRLAAILHPAKQRPAEIHPSAVISSSADLGRDLFVEAFVSIGDKSTVGDRTQIRAGAKVGDNVSIGNNCVLHPNVFVEDGCRIGNNVILHAGVVVGADGFGYVKDEKSGYVKFPQIGTVVIEDNVEIGANSCIDRGALGETRIGEGTKIDNLVQIAHNVQIGRRVVIAAQTGISGSTVIEDDCVIGGQVGMGDHARVLSGAVIGSQAGVLPGKIVRPGIWWGTPIQPLDEYKKQNAYVKSLPRLREEIKNLKEKLESRLGRNENK